MTIYEITDRPPSLMASLLDIWEASVRATHHFLSDAEVLQIRKYVPQALSGVAHLILVEREPGVPVGFMGTEQDRLEMLFLSPDVRGQGIGARLLQYGVSHCGVRTLTVNEQNPQAVGFYQHFGFSVYRRTDHDEEGGPYPLLYMKLPQDAPIASGSN